MLDITNQELIYDTSFSFTPRNRHDNQECRGKTRDQETFGVSGVLLWIPGDGDFGPQWKRHCEDKRIPHSNKRRDGKKNNGLIRRWLMNTLKDTKIGETVRVKTLMGEGRIKRRIMDMGITKGVEIYVRKVAPL